MKNKKKKDPFETYCWYREALNDPYQVFAACFDFSAVFSLKKFIKEALLFALKNKIYRKIEPANVLYRFQVIHSVMIAANCINKEHKTGPIDFAFGELLDKRLYCNNNEALAEWECFPRLLTLDEYKNPYLVFKRFFKFQPLQKWREDMQEILDYTLVSNTNDMDLNLLSRYFHLTKLFEAAHLIDVREVTHINGYYKKFSPGAVTND
ncbi:MAG: hypothetical protein QM640_17450 [Niabella sp.]